MSDTGPTGGTPSVPQLGEPGPPDNPRPAFGLVGVLSTSLRVYWLRFFPVTLVSFVTNLITYAILYQGPLGSDNAGASAGFSAVFSPGVIVSYFATLFFMAISVALVVQLCVDATMQRSTPVRQILGDLLDVIVPLTVMSLTTSVLIGAGYVAFILPGIYLTGLLVAVVPAVVLERRGYGALSRSVRLTRGYRGPIIGLVLLVQIAIELAASLVFGLIGGALDALSALTFIIVLSAVEAVPYAFVSVVMVMIYARLVELKEGAAVHDIAKVFE